MTTAKNPIPDEMTGAADADDLSVPCARQALKTRKLRGSVQDAPISAQDIFTGDEQTGATHDYRD